MFEKFKSALKNPEFQAKAVTVAGGIANLVITAVVANMVSNLVDTGIKALAEKINPTVIEIPAE
jgi:hypothetical protein